MNYSRALWFDFLPFYHMGVRASYKLNDQLTLNYWLVNGANQAESRSCSVRSLSARRAMRCRARRGGSARCSGFSRALRAPCGTRPANRVTAA